MIALVRDPSRPRLGGALRRGSPWTRLFDPLRPRTLRSGAASGRLVRRAAKLAGALVEGFPGILALSFCGCVSVAEPAPPRSHETVDEALRRVLVEGAAGGAAEVEAARAAIREYERASGRVTHLDSALALLSAAREPDRTRRIERLDAVREDPDDEVAKRLAEGALERDPAWLAAELDSDSIYSDLASFLNGVTQTLAAAVQGNPIATLQPLVVGIEGVLHGLPLDARDRARLALERRLRLEGLETEDGEGLARRVAKLRDQTAREELWLARAALDRGAFSTALAHVSVARLLDVRHEEAVELGEKIAAESRATAARRAAAFEVVEIPLDADDEFAARRDAVRRLEAVFAPSPPPSAPSGEESGRYASGCGSPGLRPTSSSRPSYRPDPSPAERIEIAKRAHSRSTWRYVFTGRRDEPDPLRRHVAARRAETRSWVDVLAPIVWLPATIVRGVYAAVGHPVDDRAILDAQAEFVRLEPDDPARVALLRELAERYERRGEHWKAVLALREAGADRAELEPVEERLAERMVRSEGVDPAVRRARLEWLAAALPGTVHAESARAELAAPRVADAGKSVPVAAALAACARVSPLRVEPRLVNGDARDGEIDPPRLRIEGMVARAEVRDGGDRRELRLDLDTIQAARLHALGDEWEWRFRAARARTYPSEHSGIPVELYAGFGASGLSVYPRLLPEGYERADRRLYE